MEDGNDTIFEADSDMFAPLDLFLRMVEENNTVAVDRLLSDWAFRSNLDINTCLIACLQRSCDSVIVDKILKHLPNMRYSDENGMRALHHAAIHGPVQNVRCIVEAGVLVNCSDLKGYRPLHYACEHGQTDIVRYLIEEGAHVNSSRTHLSGESALHIACRCGHVDTVIALLDSRADINLLILTEHGGHTPLHKAVMGDSSEVARVLCQRGASPYLTDSLGKTALHLAAEMGNIEITRILIQFGDAALVNSTDELGKTALSYAAHEGFLEVTTDLIQAGADVSLYDMNGYAPIHLAIAGRKLDVVELILGSGCDVNMQTHKSLESPLMMALSVREIDIIQMLLRHGADVNLPDFKQYTPLHRSQVLGKNEQLKERITEILLQAGSRVNARDHQGAIPLNRNIFTSVLINRPCNTGCLKLLVEAGSLLQPDAEYNRNSPLYWLCSSGCLTEAHYLVQAGWDLRCEPWIMMEGKTPQQNRLHKWFLALSRSVRPLQHYCRNKIRTRLQELSEDREIISSIQLLPVPEKVKQYLCLRDCYFTDDFDASSQVQRS
ncbi:ankyrin-1-like [Gigantopelta aegis]|uniref:ankyrin-1-like n=1 Tax=Gigantopelta aegis TaxID=1735272 RepID=UPI001B88C143|nr:ankyrin-1-like [Gigantopelta aegis]